MRGSCGPISSNPTLLRHRRDEIIGDENFRWKTFDPDDNSLHYDDDPYRSLKMTDSVHTLECWNYEGVVGIGKDQYVRFLQAGRARRFGADDTGEPSRFNERFEEWLRRDGIFAPLRPVQAGKLTGGLRLAICDRPLMDHGMTIRKGIFEALEKTFDLHDATLPAFTDDGGCFSMYSYRGAGGELEKLKIVVKSVQKVEITNSLVSLTYDVATRWTDAFACGDGLILGQRSEATYGKQEAQLLDACASVDEHMWANPLLLPVALLQMCTRRALTRTKTLESRLHNVERALGVVNAGSVKIDRERPLWPMDIDVKRQTRDLHSMLPRILLLKGVAQWQKRNAAWLLDISGSLRAKQVFTDQQQTFADIQSTIRLLASSIDGMLEFFEGLEGRTQSQINMLLRVVSQSDAITSQRAGALNYEVARSTKEDSISMTTFTFITALCLPPSFIATMFSMGMFEWGAGASQASKDTRVVSRRFWIFWAIALPLSSLTMLGWFLWYRHANRSWQRKLDRENEARQNAPVGDAWDWGPEVYWRHTSGKPQPYYGTDTSTSEESTVVERLWYWALAKWTLWRRSCDSKSSQLV